MLDNWTEVHPIPAPATLDTFVAVNLRKRVFCRVYSCYYQYVEAYL